MPQIIVLGDDESGSMMLRERLTVADFDSERFATNLVERLRWAVSDAAEVVESELTEYDVPAHHPRPTREAERVRGDRSSDDRRLIPA